jgi:hypothetical protein
MANGYTCCYPSRYIVRNESFDGRGFCADAFLNARRNTHASFLKPGYFTAPKYLSNQISVCFTKSVRGTW